MTQGISETQLQQINDLRNEILTTVGVEKAPPFEAGDDGAGCQYLNDQANLLYQVADGYHQQGDEQGSQALYRAGDYFLQQYSLCMDTPKPYPG